MGDVEEGNLKVLQQDNIRILLRPVNVEQRRLVATWPNCSCCLPSGGDVPVNLLVTFCLTVSLAVIRIFYEVSMTTSQYPFSSLADPTPIWTFQFFHLQREGIAFLAMFTAVFAVRVLMKMRREEVKTISGVIQNV